MRPDSDLVRSLQTISLHLPDILDIREWKATFIWSLQKFFEGSSEASVTEKRIVFRTIID
jgi:hypothetical protein